MVRSSDTKRAGKPKAETESARQVWQYIEAALTNHLRDANLRVQARYTLEGLVDASVKEDLDRIVTMRARQYREFTLMQLAFLVKFPGTNPLDRPKSARTQVAANLSEFLKANHIPANMNSFQNRGGGGGVSLTRNVRPEFDRMMTWSVNASQNQLKACFEYLCAELVALALPVKPWPNLNLLKLTHGAVMSLFAEMLSMHSRGNYQQYISAALLSVFNQQYNTGLRVITDKINVNDRSSKKAGDIQAASAQRTVESYEVTAEDWSSKAGRASETIRSHRLERVHVIATVKDYAAAAHAVETLDYDISVIDMYGFAATLLALLRDSTYRALALRQLYLNLESYAQDPQWVNTFVDLLHQKGLTVGSTQ